MSDINDMISALGCRLSVVRRMLNLRQADVAILAGVSRSTVCEIEKGAPSVEMGNCFRVFGALGILHEIEGLAKSGAGDVHGVRRRVSRMKVQALPANHRAEKNRRQEMFLRSGHPGAYGIWNRSNPEIANVPNIGDSRSW